MNFLLYCGNCAFLRFASLSFLVFALFSSFQFGMLRNRFAVVSMGFLVRFAMGMLSLYCSSNQFGMLFCFVFNVIFLSKLAMHVQLVCRENCPLW